MIAKRAPRCLGCVCCPVWIGCGGGIGACIILKVRNIACSHDTPIEGDNKKTNQNIQTVTLRQTYAKSSYLWIVSYVYNNDFRFLRTSKQYLLILPQNLSIRNTWRPFTDAYLHVRMKICNLSRLTKHHLLRILQWNKAIFFQDMKTIENYYIHN